MKDIKNLEKNYEIIKKEINDSYEFYINRFKNDFKFTDEDIEELLFIFETRYYCSYSSKKHNPYYAGKEKQAIAMSNIFLERYLDKHFKNKKDEINIDFDFDFDIAIKDFYRVNKAKDYIFDENYEYNYAYCTELVYPTSELDRWVILCKDNDSNIYDTFEIVDSYDSIVELNYEVPEEEKEKLLNYYNIKL